MKLITPFSVGVKNIYLYWPWNLMAQCLVDVPLISLQEAKYHNILHFYEDFKVKAFKCC
jgi:hypothetical protein